VNVAEVVEYCPGDEACIVCCVRKTLERVEPRSDPSSVVDKFVSRENNRLREAKRLSVDNGLLTSAFKQKAILLLLLLLLFK
jgi:serine/threonine protein kinase HipA of HipAB toxin-antitoxin module